MLRCEQQPVGQETGSAVERTLGGYAGKLRKVIAFREMPKDYIGSLTVILGFKVGGCRLIGEVSNAGQNPLLDGPWIRTVAKHFQIVIGLK